MKQRGFHVCCACVEFVISLHFCTAGIMAGYVPTRTYTILCMFLITISVFRIYSLYSYSNMCYRITMTVIYINDVFAIILFCINNIFIQYINNMAIKLASIHNLRKDRGRRGLRSYVVRKKPGNQMAEQAYLAGSYLMDHAPSSKPAFTKKLLLPRRRLLQYSSLFMAPAGIMQYWFHLDALPPFFPVNFPCFAKEMFSSRSRQDRNPNSQNLGLQTHSSN